MNSEEELKRVCDEYISALSHDEFDYHGDDFGKYAPPIVKAALVLVYGSEIILQVEEALLNYHEYQKLNSQ